MTWVSREVKEVKDETVTAHAQYKIAGMILSKGFFPRVLALLSRVQHKDVFSP